MTLELKVPPVAQVLIVAALMLGLAQRFPWPAVAPGGSFAKWVALVLVALGMGVAVLGVLEFRRARTTVDPRYPERAARLVDGGIYRFTRNPMYLGMLLVLTALALYLRSLAPWLMLPVFVLYMNRFQIVAEERAMQQLFDREFSRYCERVRRWI